MSDRGRWDATLEDAARTDTAPIEGPAPLLARGEAVGRYMVVDHLGGGGMGIVYSAYDPELDRKLAIKLLRPGSGGSTPTEGRTRLLREAQALARLSHPNVIAVHDVGTFRDQVFIAMEFVQGATLGGWLKKAKRSWPEIVEVFEQAGRGLVAAHAAGIVHRDFKPENVLCGDDGRVRVADFGLARGETAPPPPTPDVERAPTELSAHVLSTPLTLSGALVGTPAYAAPEQLLGRHADARSDQFSFCVALHEALYGQRPFAAQTLVELVAAIQDGRVAPPPEGSDVPGWLRELTLRGLRADPAQRHPSMADVLRALSQRPTRRRRWVVGAAAAGLVLAALAVVATRGRSEPTCQDAQARLAAVWDVARARAIQQAFVATGKPYAADAFNGVRQALDGFAAAWEREYAVACPQAQARAADETAYLRMACLSQRLDEASAKTELFLHADAKTVENAAGMVQTIEPPAECARTPERRLVGPPAPPPALRAQILEVQKQVASARALEQAGRFSDGLGIARQAAERARALEYAPLLAEALLQLGHLQHALSDLPAAEKTLLDAAFTAEGARSDETAARAWADLALQVGDMSREYVRADEMVRHGFVALERLGGNQRIEAYLHNVLGSIRYRQGRYAEAAAQNRRAVELSAHGSDERERSWYLNDLANTLAAQGQVEDALHLFTEAYDIKRRLLGPAHPDTAVTQMNIGLMLVQLGRHRDARERYDAVLQVFKAAEGPTGFDVAATLTNLGDLDLAEHDAARALADQQQALVIWEKTMGAQHPILAYALVGMGKALVESGQPARAVAPLERAVSLRESAAGDAVELAEARFALARALGRSRPRAVQLATAARATYAGAGGHATEVTAIDRWLSR